jgi:hypothetical protein
MKKLLLLLLVVAPMVLHAESALTNARLVGIINIENQKLAVLEDPSSPARMRRELILREAQREDDLELIEIRPEQGTVKAKVSGASAPQILGLRDQSQLSIGSFQGLTLEDVGTATMLKLFAALSGRTVLQHPTLPALKFTVKHSTTNRAEAAQILKDALTEKQITVVPDGEKFVLIAPKSQAANLNPHSAQLPTTSTNSASIELIPAGSITFHGALTAQVLAIYAEFRGDKLDRNSPLPPRAGSTISLTMETALTKEECLYAMETLLNWNGITLAPAGDGLVKAVPISPK